MKYIVEVNGERIEVDLEVGTARIGNETFAATVVELPGTPTVLLRLGSTTYRLVVRPGEARGIYGLTLDGHRYETEALDERAHAIRELSKVSGAATGPAPLVAPMPGLIVRVNVGVGDAVKPGQALVVMEAMKMENELRASAAATVRAVRVTPGTAVDKGATLVELS